MEEFFLPCEQVDDFSVECFIPDSNGEILAINYIGTYRLLDFEEENSIYFNVSPVDPIELKENVECFGEQAETSQTITNETLSFAVVLKDENSVALCGK